VVLVPPGVLDEPMVIAILPDERVLIIERKGALKATTRPRTRRVSSR
jgi:hypothetical protein